MGDDEEGPDPWEKRPFDDAAKKDWEMEQQKRRDQLDTSEHMCSPPRSDEGDSGSILSSIASTVNSVATTVGGVVGMITGADEVVIEKNSERVPERWDPKGALPDPSKCTDAERAITIKPLELLAKPIPPHAGMTTEEARKRGPAPQGSPYWKKMAEERHVKQAMIELVNLRWKVIKHNLAAKVMMWHANAIGISSPQSTVRMAAPLSPLPGSKAHDAQTLLQKALKDSEIQDVIDAAAPAGWHAEVILSPKQMGARQKDPSRRTSL